MKLLIIDDDDIVCHALAQYLSTCGYASDRARNAKEATEFLKEVTYDLILLDVMLPDIDGISFCQSLRSQDIKSLIFLMTASDQCDSITGLDAGADDYIKKPFGLAELAARVKALLRRNREIQHQVLSWRDAQLDLATSQITVQSQSLVLNSREKNLLALLIQDDQRIYSQPSLLKYLWPIDDDLPGEEAVRTLIRRLRQKLAAIDASEIIETVYGLGYRLNWGWGQPTATAESPAIHPVAFEPELTLDPPYCQSVALTAQQVQLMLLADIERLRDWANHPIKVDQHQAQRMAHRLIGSLGVLQLPSAVTIAQAVSRQLDCPVVRSADLGWLVEATAELTAIVEAATPLMVQEFLSASPEHGPSSVNRDRPQMRILVLDDDQLILKLLEKMLQPWGVEVHVISQATQLLAALNRVKPDVLILDLNLPDGNGIELCQMLRMNSQWADLSIIILTSQRNSETIRQVFDAGADDFVSKPIVPPELLARLLKRFEQSQSHQNQLRCDPLTGLANQTASYDRLEQTIAQLNGADFCLIVIQVNHLTALVAEYGHLVRDRWIKLFTIALQQQLPDTTISRWHGGEFVMGMNLTQVAIAREFERIHPALQLVMVSPMRHNPVTINVAIVERSPQCPDLATLFQQAMAQLVTTV